MRKIWTVASLVAAGTLATASVPAAPADFDGPIPAAQKGQSVKKKSKQAAAKHQFLYLDMVERKHPSSIRKAVIIYDYGRGNSQCDAADGKSVSECLRGPST